MSKELLVVLGTRPEAIKLAPIINEMRKLGIPLKVILTGQHKELMRGTPLSIVHTTAIGEVLLDIPFSLDLSLWVDKAITRLEDLYHELNPSAIMVYGDTKSTFSAADASKYLYEVPLLHVEAGVRSRDMENPFPEEWFRTRISQWASWHYATTPNNRNNLILDHVRPEKIILTGSSAVSALDTFSGARVVLEPLSQVLVTLHRRELLFNGVDEVVKAVIDEARIQEGVEFIWPVHPHLLKVVSKSIFIRVPGNMQIVDPLPYREAVKTLSESLGVLTDSGGLCEEAATLGVPCAVLRYVTDRPEAVAEGVAKVFEPTPLEARKAIAMLINRELPRRATAVYGSPDAAAKIAAHVKKVLN